MSKIYTTEITSDTLPSDNPIHQRLLKAYIVAKPYVTGDVLEVGCGEGRGIEIIIENPRSYTAIDKIEPVILDLQKKFPSGKFISGNIPPLANFADNSFDRVFSFQVIEHITNDLFFLEEIHRVLKPSGIALLTTPNHTKSLSRNPWHIREYTADQLTNLAKGIFAGVEMKGITGNEKVMTYYESNKRSVKRLARFDIFDLQHRLPASILKIPYEFLNRWNRNKLQSDGDALVSGITTEDYIVIPEAAEALDLLLIATKA